MFGTSIPINMFRTFAFVFYVEKLGLDSSLYALIISLYTFLDAIDNIIYGYLSDRTRTKWGRRRPWLVIGTPLFCICFFIFYSPDLFGVHNNIFAFCALFYIITGTLDSLINANYGALFPDLFQSDTQRAKTNAMKQAFQFIAMIIGIAATPMIVDIIGYSMTALIYAIIGGGTILFCTFGCHENPKYVQMEKPKLIVSLSFLFKNKKFWIAGLANAFYSAALGLVMSSIPLYAKYTLGIDSTKQSILFASVLLVAIAAVALWAFLVKKYTLIKIWKIALIILCISFLPFYFANSFISAIYTASILGFGLAGVVTTMDLIGAKIIDEDAKKSGIRKEGIYSSAMGFLNRLNGFVTAAVLFLASTIYGYKNGDEPGLNPSGVAKFLLIICPFIIMLGAVITSRFLNFDEKENAKKVEITNLDVVE